MPRTPSKPKQEITGTMSAQIESLAKNYRLTSPGPGRLTTIQDSGMAAQRSPSRSTAKGRTNRKSGQAAKRSRSRSTTRGRTNRKRSSSRKR